VRISRVLVGAAIATGVGLVLFVTARSTSLSGDPRPSRASEDASPSAVTEDPTPSADSEGRPGAPIRLQNLTTGLFWKEGPATSQTTAPLTLPANSFVLVHLMSCCDHAPVPKVAGAGLTFDLVVTHETGQKRHWVFGAANEGGRKTAPLTFTFASNQGVILWVVDSALNVELGNGGADAVVQTAWQDSQGNADHGIIPLEPFEDPHRNAAVVFALAGSGTATDIEPERGMRETAEAEVGASSLIIDTFWKIGEDRSPAATFVDEAGQPVVESWLFLAVELRARSASP
jgi:hypothetical protein